MVRKFKKKEADKNKAKGTFVFFIGDEGATLVYMEEFEVLRRLYSPAPDDPATEAFKELLAAHPEARIYLMADLVDQSYVRHTLPPVTPLGVNKIIQRRLARDFAPDDLKGAISLGRESSGRKDWNFLLVALSYSGSLRAWCELVYELPNRFMGVYLAPVESEHIIHALKSALASGANAAKKGIGDSLKSLSQTFKKKPQKDNMQAFVTQWDIFVVHNKTGGFRQVVLKNGKLVFTRMAQSAAYEKPTVMAGNIEQEVKNTIEYLKRLSFSDAADLNILLLVGEDIKPHLSTEGLNAKSAHVLTPYEAAEQFDLTNAVLSGDRYSDIFLSCAFIKARKRKLRLMPSYTKKMEQFYTMLQGVRAATALTMVGLILSAAYYFYNGVLVNNELVDIRAEDKQLANRVSDFEEEASTFEVDPFKVDSLIKITDLLQEERPTYSDVVNLVTPAVERGITVQEFDWMLNGMESMAERDNQSSRRSRGRNSRNRQQESETGKVRAMMVFELKTMGREEEVLMKRWDTLFTSMQERSEAYQLVRSAIPGFDNANDELSINFEEESQMDEQEALLDKKVIVNVDITSKPEEKDKNARGLMR